MALSKVAVVMAANRTELALGAGLALVNLGRPTYEDDPEELLEESLHARKPNTDTRVSRAMVFIIALFFISTSNKERTNNSAELFGHDFHIAVNPLKLLIQRQKRTIGIYVYPARPHRFRKKLTT
jgi:hypothetical protein